MTKLIPFTDIDRELMREQQEAQKQQAEVDFMLKEGYRKLPAHVGPYEYVVDAKLGSNKRDVYIKCASVKIGGDA